MARILHIDDIVNGIKLVIDNPAKPNMDWSGHHQYHHHLPHHIKFKYR